MTANMTKRVRAVHAEGSRLIWGRRGPDHPGWRVQLVVGAAIDRQIIDGVYRPLFRGRWNGRVFPRTP